MKNKILNVEITSEEQRNELVKQLQEMKFEKPLPSSWDEYLNNLTLEEAEVEEAIINYLSGCINEKYSAMYKLEKLMGVYNDGWKPDWHNAGGLKWVVLGDEDKSEIAAQYMRREFLSFKNHKTADLFVKNFKPLIKQYFEID